MPKQGGFPFTLTVQDAADQANNIANDVQTLSIKTPRGEVDVTGLDKSAVERLLLLADSELTLGGTFNPTADKSHDTFKTVSSDNLAASQREVVFTIGGKSLTLQLVFSDYALTRGADGSFTWTVTGKNATGAVPTWA